MVWPLGVTNPRLPMPRLHAFIRGRVQGVFFRASIIEQARALDIAGFVRNRHDGAVEVVAEGAADALATLRQYCKKGPPGAIVREFDVIDEAESGEFNGFGVRPEV
jgi:acylphosphatase